MNKKLTKVIGLIMAGAMTVMAGCGNSAPAAQGSADNAAPAQEAETTTQSSGKAKKIGVLVADVSGEEALGFRNYYEKYIQENYDVTFDYTDALASAEDEKAAIEKFASKGYDAV
ncbi:MAG: sugar ABC transporter substrate-binding protein, partial [Butyrivibrio sp.]|nr:sugar ABC transporter substrate-binding protein [Butyrivibrio sp.]